MISIGITHTKSLEIGHFFRRLTGVHGDTRGESGDLTTFFLSNEESGLRYPLDGK
jgi:hypothetical protein